MNQEAYVVSYYSKENLYWFESHNPRSKDSIFKTVRFQEMGEPNRYNLALASVIDNKEDYNHEARNRDIDKIFQTLVKIAEHFFTRKPKAQIFVEGNTPVKTRGYQMRISKHLEQIEKSYNVFALIEKGADFVKFIKGKSYVGFLFTRK